MQDFIIETLFTFRQTPIFFSPKSNFTFHLFCPILPLKLYSTFCQTPIFFSPKSNSTFHLFCTILPLKFYSTFGQAPTFFSPQSYSTFHPTCIILSLKLFFSFHQLQVLLYKPYLPFTKHSWFYYRNSILLFPSTLSFFLEISLFTMNNFIIETVYYSSNTYLFSVWTPFFPIIILFDFYFHERNKW